MKNYLTKIKDFFNTKLGFFVLAVVLFWLKTIYAYSFKFNLGVKGSMQYFLMLLNPFPTAILLFGITLYMKGRKSYIYLLLIDAITSIWLFSNVLYYREFSDFLTMTLIKGSGSVGNNLGASILGIIRPSDFFVFLDIAILIVLLATHLIKVDVTKLKWHVPTIVSLIAIFLFGVNLTLSESDRSGLLTRTFDNNYIVKYLGLNTYTVYDGVKTVKTQSIRNNAKSSDLNSVKKYMKANYVTPNVEYTGVSKGKNVFIIHLESFQQFLIDYKWKGQEVTPNLNRIYHQQDTLSFDNFFHQVGQGKTSDAETMLENSLFGLPDGSVTVNYGTSNTFQAAPAILDQNGYTTASFHGDVPSFWNRDNAYKSWGYDYFFSSEYFKSNKKYRLNYGMKDKIFLQESAQYLEQLPQPFYAKMITVTNHYPYPLDKKNQTIDKTDTGDPTVDGYVQTAKYLDQSVGEFMNWLEETGLEKNSTIVFYGDHFGISANHKKAVAKLLGKKKFNEFDNAQFQKVPLMIHMQGLKGGINHTYGGEIDVLPTLMNLLGISDKNYIQFGSDLLSKDHNQTVAFRNGDFVTPQYTKVGSTYYNTVNGKKLKKISPEIKVELNKLSNRVTTELSLSDRVVTGDLLRFYTPDGFKRVNKKDFSYKKSFAKKKLKDELDQNSLISQIGQSSVDNYHTDAPELSK